MIKISGSNHASTKNKYVIWDFIFLFIDALFTIMIRFKSTTTIFLATLMMMKKTLSSTLNRLKSYSAFAESTLKIKQLTKSLRSLKRTAFSQSPEKPSGGQAPLTKSCAMRNTSAMLFFKKHIPPTF